MIRKDFLSTRQAALRLGVSLGTVQNMVEAGALEAWKTAGGHRRIPIAAIDGLLAKRFRPGGLESDQLDLLIIDADPEQRATYERTIKGWKLPIHLHFAENGVVGLLQIGQRTPDVLICSTQLPGMDGETMLSQLLAGAPPPGMDVIAIGADANAPSKLPEAITRFSKPIPFHELKGFILGRLAAFRRH
ncbi:MAG: excisionase family DNA-binding protein [Azonexus sp.]|jgi:excisionase family DNA binding protein